MPDSVPDSIADLTIAESVLAWYAAHARDLPWRRPPGAPFPTDPAWPYRVWLSEIMLQQTTVAAVAPYFARFTARWPNVTALAAADDAEVMQQWAGLGYYARARNLLACARVVTADHASRFPADETTLLTLPGVGAYTAAAIAAFAFGQRALIIDGNIERLVTRLFALPTALPAGRAEIAAALDAITPANAADFAQGCMDLARSVCTPKAPRCLACPLRAHCQAAARGTPEAFPVKAAKRPRPHRRGIAWWLEAAGEVLTITRPPRGLLGNMVALPSTDWATTPPPAAPPHPGAWHHLGTVTHGFTHFELSLDIRALQLPAKPELAGEWRPVHQAGAGMPTVFVKAVALALAMREGQ